MEIFLDCLPCLMRQCVEIARKATDDIELQNEIIQKSIKILSDYKKYANPPDMARDFSAAIKKITGIHDLYKDIKDRDIAAAKSLLPMLKNYLNNSGDRLYDVLKISAIGNNIDSAIYADLKIEECIEKELEKKFSICDITIFQNKLKNAESIMIIGDNSGESVFDCLLAEYLLPKKIIYAVRGEPVMNDVTKAEAYASGLDSVAQIVSSGCNSPGLLIGECDKKFQSLFYNADIVISKGQGNFEALSNAKRDIFYLLKAKCQMVTKELKTDINGYVFKYNIGN